MIIKQQSIIELVEAGEAVEVQPEAQGLFLQVEKDDIFHDKSKQLAALHNMSLSSSSHIETTYKPLSLKRNSVTVTNKNVSPPSGLNLSSKYDKISDNTKTRSPKKVKIQLPGDGDTDVGIEVVAHRSSFSGQSPCDKQQEQPSNHSDLDDEESISSSKLSGLSSISGISNLSKEKKKAIKAQLEVNKKFQKDVLAQVEGKLKKQKKMSSISNFFVISSANMAYQIWKIVLILLSFASSFIYAYFGVFLTQLSKKEQQLCFELDTFFEFIFITDIILHFFEEHRSQISQEVVRDLKQLFLIYIKGRFVFDVIAVIPLYEMLEGWIDPQFLKTVYFVKLIRLFNGFELLSYKNFMIQIKGVYNKRIQKLISRNKKLAESRHKDSTKITTIVKISKFLKISQLIIVILCLSSLSGLFWYLMCDLVLYTQGDDENNFIEYFGLKGVEPKTILSTMTYFAFTTISTVGLGDYHPRTDLERSVGVFFMLFGVLITSYVMENLNQIMVQLREFNKSFDLSQQLSLFFGTMRRFNDNIPLRDATQAEIERHFQFRWVKDLNLAINTQQDRDLLDQLPKVIQNKIYTEFLFKNFLETYTTFFISQESLQATYKRLQKAFAGKFRDRVIQQYFFQQVQVDWNNETYQKFVIGILKVLEPKLVDNKTILQKQNSNIEEIIFVNKGEFEVGYNHEYFLYEAGFQEIENVGAFKKLLTKKWRSSSHYSTQLSIGAPLLSTTTKVNEGPTNASNYINKFRFPVSIPPGVLGIGMFEICYQKKSQFLYRAKINSDVTYNKDYGAKGVECFYVRKKYWQELVNQSEKMQEVCDQFKGSAVVNSYLKKVYLPIQEYQQGQIKNEIASQKSQAKQEYEAINTKINARVQTMMEQFKTKKSELKKFQKIKKKSSREVDEFKNDDESEPEGTLESSGSSDDSDSSSESQNSNSIQMSYESDDSFVGEAQQLLESTNLEPKQKKKILKVQNKIKELRVSSHHQDSAKQGQRKIITSMKEEFLRNIAFLKKEQEQKLEFKQVRKNVRQKSMNIQKKQHDPIIDLLSEHDKVLKTQNYKLFKSEMASVFDGFDELDFYQLVKRSEAKVTQCFLLMADLLEVYYDQAAQLKVEQTKIRYLENSLQKERSGYGLRLLSCEPYQQLKRRKKIQSSSDYENLYHEVDVLNSQSDFKESDNLSRRMPNLIEELTAMDVVEPSDCSSISASIRSEAIPPDDRLSYHSKAVSEAKPKSTKSQFCQQSQQRNSGMTLQSYVTPEKNAFNLEDQITSKSVHVDQNYAQLALRQKNQSLDFNSAHQEFDDQLLGGDSSQKSSVSGSRTSVVSGGKRTQRLTGKIVIGQLEEQKKEEDSCQSSHQKIKESLEPPSSTNSKKSVKLKPIKQKLSRKALEIVSQQVSYPTSGQPPLGQKTQTNPLSETYSNEGCAFAGESEIRSQKRMSIGNTTHSLSRKDAVFSMNQSDFDDDNDKPEKQIPTTQRSRSRRFSTKHKKLKVKQNSLVLSDKGSKKPPKLNHAVSRVLDEVPESKVEQEDEEDVFKNQQSLTNSVALPSVSQQMIEESLPETQNLCSQNLDVKSNKHSHAEKSSKRSKFGDQISIDEEIQVEEGYMSGVWEEDQESSEEEIREQKTIPEEITTRRKTSVLSEALIGSFAYDYSNRKSLNGQNESERGLLDHGRDSSAIVIERSRKKKRMD